MNLKPLRGELSNFLTAINLSKFFFNFKKAQLNSF